MSRQQDAEHHIQYAEDRIDETCTQTDREALLVCVHDEIKSAQDHGRAKSDLDAQVAMALWAKIMTLSGIAGSVLAGGGLYLVWRTLETTSDAVGAAKEANKIMNDQSAGYLVIESVEMQTQTVGVLVKMTVRNIGNRPVRRARATGHIRFMWSEDQGEVVPSFQSARAKAEPFVGVIAPHQTASGVDLVLFSALVGEREVYERYIRGNSSADFDCRLLWDDTNSVHEAERHILSVSSLNSIFETNGADPIKLSVSYSGMSKDWEERNAKGGD